MGAGRRRACDVKHPTLRLNYSCTGLATRALGLVPGGRLLIHRRSARPSGGLVARHDSPYSRRCADAAMKLGKGRKALLHKLCLCCSVFCNGSYGARREAACTTMLDAGRGYSRDAILPEGATTLVPRGFSRSMQSPEVHHPAGCTLACKHRACSYACLC